MAFEITKLVNRILDANDAYRMGEPIMTDQEYDSLLDRLKELDPGNALLSKGIIEEPKGKDRMEKLPVPMYSLEKVKSWGEIKDWLSQFGDDEVMAITPKYDGISLVTSTGKDVKAWTRGDGETGQASHRRFQAMNRLQEGFDLLAKKCDYCWGEAIMRKDFFKKYLENGDYKTARNMVAGQFNADKWNPEILKDTSYIVYGCDMDGVDKLNQLSCFLDLGMGHDYTATRVYEIKKSEKDGEDIFHMLYRKWSEFYNIDGIVMEVNAAGLRRHLGRLPNGNPKYAIAVKFPEWNDSKVARVEYITWKISKDGVSNPVINIKPTELCGVTVCNVSGHNARYIVDNHIHPGALIQVRRSGDVIPKHDKTISWCQYEWEDTMDDMMSCPSCGRSLQWDSTHTELICSNPGCWQKVVARNLFFFVTMGIEEIGDPTIMRLYHAGYKTIKDILSFLFTGDWSTIKGLGDSIQGKLREQIDNLTATPIPLARLLTACNVFGGNFGEKTCQLIFNEIRPGDLSSLLSKLDEPTFYDELVAIKGVGEITAKVFICSLREMERDLNAIPFFLFPVYLEEEKKEPAGETLSICFSGVRDKELEKEIINAGHTVASGVSKNTSILIVKDVNGGSSKITKARELGVDIIAIGDREEILKRIKGL